MTAVMRRWKRAVNQCLVCGRFLKRYGDGWATSVHDGCQAPRDAR